NADTRAGTNFSHPPVEAEKPMAPGGHELASVVQPDPADFLPYVLPVQPSDPSGHDAPVLGEGVHGQRLGRRTPFTLAVEGESGRVSRPDVLRLDQGAVHIDELVLADAFSESHRVRQDRAEPDPVQERQPCRTAFPEGTQSAVEP